jgi:hypothetical protein
VGKWLRKMALKTGTRGIPLAGKMLQGFVWYTVWDRSLAEF